jgi:hypothetical protein
MINSNYLEEEFIIIINLLQKMLVKKKRINNLMIKYQQFNFIIKIIMFKIHRKVKIIKIFTININLVTNHF